MAVALKEVCAKCGRAMTDADIGDYWYHSEPEPSFKCLCTLCAHVYRLHEPDGSVRSRREPSVPPQPTLL
ncbi:hypothetical protein ES703_68470 [subsurface metagenome]